MTTTRQAGTSVTEHEMENVENSVSVGAGKRGVEEVEIQISEKIVSISSTIMRKSVEQLERFNLCKSSVNQKISPFRRILAEL